MVIKMKGKKMADAVIDTPECVEKKSSLKIMWKDLVAPALGIVLASAVIAVFTMLFNISSSISAVNQRVIDFDSRLSTDEKTLSSRIDTVDTNINKLDSKIDNITNILIQKK